MTQKTARPSRLIIHDATIGEGERSPGTSISLDEKLRIARQLGRLHVDVIDAGVPMSSPAEFEAVRRIAHTVQSCTVSATCLPVRSHIDRTREALQGSASPRIRLSVDAVPEDAAGIEALVESVRYARTLVDDVSLLLGNAPTARRSAVCDTARAAASAGASTIVLADRSGYSFPDEYGVLFEDVGKACEGTGPVTLAALCQNDLGLAVACSLSAVKHGAREVVCAVNGIGPRAGITPLEEIVVAIRLRPADVGCDSGIESGELWPASRLVSRLTGMPVGRNKPIVGPSAFVRPAGPAPEAPGGVRLTPQMVGIQHSTVVLGKHSDQVSLQQRYTELGCTVAASDMAKVYALFRQIAEQKREILDEDLLALLEAGNDDAEEYYHLEGLQVHSGTTLRPTATIELRRGNERLVDSATGDGPVDAVYRAIHRMTGLSGELTEYLTKSVGAGGDALAEVFVRVAVDGVEFHGRGMSTDVIEGSARAYLEALNRAQGARKRRGGE